VSGRTPGAESGRKLLSVLLAFDEQHPTWTVGLLSEHLALPLSTTYRYIALLREQGLLDASGDGTYRVTHRVASLARAAEAARESMVELARPILESTRDAVDETVVLVTRGGTYAYCVDRAESRQPVRLQFSAGQAMPLHSGSASRVLLAAMPRGERTEYLRGVLPTLPVERAGNLADDALDRVLAAGWTESFEEVDDGIWGAAAAVRADGDVIAALGAAGPIYRLQPADRKRIVTAVRSAAAQLSGALS
jgi:DNA-binding IclR family transcriptional regulator